MSLDPVKHVETYPPATLDATTIRNVRRIAQENVGELNRIRDAMTNPDHIQVWDDCFADDTAALNGCIKRLEDELAARGLPL